jgi:hypothetical protein
VTRKLDVTGPLKRYILAAHMAAGSNKWRDAAVAWRSAFDIAQVCIFLIFFSPPPLSLLLTRHSLCWGKREAVTTLS